MTHTNRFVALTFCILLTYLLTAAGSPPVADSLTSEQQELVDFARSRFALAGIDLPDVAIEFPADETACHGYGGVYLPTEHTVRICRPSKTTMVHELAHSWIETTFDEDDRRAFLAHRGLETWAGGSGWDERGAEHAAEIITWAIMDENISIRWVETNADGTTVETWRLYKLPDSSPDQLASAYRALTGNEPVLRIADDPRTVEPTPEPTSPEAQRWG